MTVFVFIFYGSFISSPVSTIGVLVVAEAFELSPMLGFYCTYDMLFVCYRSCGLVTVCILFPVVLLARVRYLFFIFLWWWFRSLPQVSFLLGFCLALISLALFEFSSLFLSVSVSHIVVPRDGTAYVPWRNGICSVCHSRLFLVAFFV